MIERDNQIYLQVNSKLVHKFLWKNLENLSQVCDQN